MTTDPNSAWHQEVLSHLDWLRSVVRSRLGEFDSSEDVLNDVVADALALENPFQRVSKPGPWLYRVAIRKVLLYRRKSGRRRRAYRRHHESGSQNEGSCSTPLDQMLGEERRDAVRQALSKLAGQDVEILLLKYVHEWSYSQISDNLGLDHWKVVHRLRKARHCLRQLLASSITNRK